jgi:hypothetical protein
MGPAYRIGGLCQRTRLPPAIASSGRRSALRSLNGLPRTANRSAGAPLTSDPSGASPSALPGLRGGGGKRLQLSQASCFE